MQSMKNQTPKFLLSLQEVDWTQVASEGCFVYAYLRSKNSENGKAGSPYYVGLATRARRPLDKNHSTKLPCKKEYIVLLKKGLTRAEAQKLESKYIAHFGRIDLKNGILRNKTPGGESFANSPDVRQKALNTFKETISKRTQDLASELNLSVQALESLRRKVRQEASAKAREIRIKELGMTKSGYQRWIQDGKPEGDLSSYQKRRAYPKRDKKQKAEISIRTTAFYEAQALEQGFNSLEERKKFYAKEKRRKMMEAARSLGMTKRQYQAYRKSLKYQNA